MKKILFSICFLFLLNACEDELELIPISGTGSNGFYRNADDFQKAVNGTYEQLTGYPNRHFYLSDVRSDNIYGVGQAGVRPHEPINNFAATLATNEYMPEAWNENYIGIMRANTILDKLNETLVSQEALRNQFEGEARFLRALYYFDLVRWFGKVPIFTTFVTASDALKIPRSPVAEVYNLIISDLETAIQKLPESHTGANLGRATSFAAKGILARVLLTRSGPNYNINGPGLASNEYAKALTLLNDIINSGKFAMLPEFAKIFDYDNENNKEIIFDIQFVGGGLGLGSTYPGEMVPDNYFKAVNVPFPGGLEVKRVSKNLLNSFGTVDVRRKFTVQEGYTLTGAFVDESFYRKFLNEGKRGIDRFDWGINFPVLRYTDVLMMKAECLLQSGGAQAEVDAIVNMVRTRAGLPPINDVTLRILMEERRKEFAAEGLRWHDLVRSGLVLEVINAWIPTEDVQKQMLHPINANHIIYPVPQAQLDVKKGLYDQNPGYN